MADELQQHEVPEGLAPIIVVEGLTDRPAAVQVVVGKPIVQGEVIRPGPSFDPHPD